VVFNHVFILVTCVTNSEYFIDCLWLMPVRAVVMNESFTAPVELAKSEAVPVIKNLSLTVGPKPVSHLRMRFLPTASNPI